MEAEEPCFYSPSSPPKSEGLSTSLKATNFMWPTAFEACLNFWDGSQDHQNCDKHQDAAQQRALFSCD
jgi:hypothetical protein